VVRHDRSLEPCRNRSVASIRPKKKAPARGAPRAGNGLELRQPLSRVVLPSRPKFVVVDAPCSVANHHSIVLACLV
jgi:hypothetical protein